MESKYPPWQSVYYYYRKWKKTGVWEQILDSLVIQERERQGKSNPAALAADSQSVRKVAFIHLDTGIDGGKFINGRKRHILVDDLGLPWSIYVSAANISDTAAGCQARLSHFQNLKTAKASISGYLPISFFHVG